MGIINQRKEQQLNLFIYCESCFRVVVLEDMRKIGNRVVDDTCGGIMENWIIETTCRACERFMLIDEHEFIMMKAASDTITNGQMNEIVNMVMSGPGRMCRPSFASMDMITSWFGNGTRIIHLYVDKNERCVTGVKVLKTPVTNFFL